LKAAKWQAAMEALILVATSGGPTMFARIGVMKALNRHVERVFNPDRKDHHWGRRKLKKPATVRAEVEQTRHAAARRRNVVGGHLA
jgi:hypothetical protein